MLSSTLKYVVSTHAVVTINYCIRHTKDLDISSMKVNSEVNKRAPVKGGHYFRNSFDKLGKRTTVIIAVTIKPKVILLGK